MRVAGTFTSTGSSDAATLFAPTQFGLDFGTGTVQLQVSYDGGTNWHTVESYTADVHDRVNPPATGLRWRFNCSVHSADIDYFLV